jgi:tetratricopeptide (TPR) repeat protein
MKLSDQKHILILLLFVILGFGIYSNTLKAPFYFDDTIRILDNPHIRITKLTFKEIGKAGFKSSSSRPIAFITFALNYYFHQYNLKGYHAVNIIIHILSGIFLYLLIKATLNLPLLRPKYDYPDLIAFFTALAWLVNPVHTQSVTYIVQRLNSMAAMFFVLSLLLYVKGRISQRQYATQNLQSETESKPKAGLSSNSRKTAFSFQLSAFYLYYSGSVLTWILALGSKQTAAMLPFIIFLYEWYFFQDLSKDWLKRHLKYLSGIFIVFGLIAFIYLGLNPLERITSIADYAHKEFTFTERVLTQFRVIIYYISLLFYPNPSRLNLDYDFPLSHSLIDPISTLLCLCAIIGLIGLACYMAKKERLVSFCILWFFGNLVIESSIIPLAIIFEHRTYLPSMLIFLPAVLLVSRHITSKRLRVVLVCTIVMVSSFWTYQRNNVWSDEVALWKDCEKKSPNKARPHINLGKALNKQGRTEEAINHYLQALRINPDDTDAYNNLGIALFSKGNNKEAIASFREALRIKPDYADAHNNLGVALGMQGRTEDAIYHYLQALRIKPDYADAHNNLGFSLDRQDRTEEATYHYLQALRIKPDYAEAHYNLGNVLLKQGKTDKALFRYQKALSINPKFTLAMNRLAVVHMIKEEYDKAISIFKKLIELQPNDAIAHYNISCMYSRKNNIEESISWLKKAIKKGYDNWDLIKTDKDLENIRGSSYYKELVKDH